MALLEVSPGLQSVTGLALAIDHVPALNNVPVEMIKDAFGINFQFFIIFKDGRHHISSTPSVPSVFRQFLHSIAKVLEVFKTF